ncbi:MAG TPA: Mpo1-like protein [Pseudolabrys sp.]|nr:Mpo1-like protein [Pseudolabrys sp.]
MASVFARQLATYASYHKDVRNRATHFIGIPAIVFAILLPLALLRTEALSAAMIVAALALIGWIALDRVIGVAMAVVLLPMLVVAEWIARTSGGATVWILFAVFFVGGWVFQLVGHAWEGRRPALADNLFQAFIGPMFLMAEVLIALGLKQDLKAAIDNAR